MLKQVTLDALNRMLDDKAFRAARAIVNYWHGSEFGIEYLPLPDDNEAPYVNTGDTYNVTLILTPEGWIVSSWGDYMEEVERRYAEETGETLCGWCGEWSLFEGSYCGNCGKEFKL